MPADNKDVYLRMRQVRERFGNVSHMWVERRVRSDPTFPRPVKFGSQRFWRLGELIAWEQKQPQEAAT